MAHPTADEDCFKTADIGLNASESDSFVSPTHGLEKEITRALELYLYNIYYSALKLQET